jgi:hypothetical protein
MTVVTRRRLLEWIGFLPMLSHVLGQDFMFWLLSTGDNAFFFIE